MKIIHWIDLNMFENKTTILEINYTMKLLLKPDSVRDQDAKYPHLILSKPIFLINI